MRIPQTPPPVRELIEEISSDRMMQLLELAQTAKTPQSYLHWDKLRHHKAPEGIHHREWWLLEKLARMRALQDVPLKDKKGNPFQFCIPGFVQKELHQIDLGMGGQISMPEPITNPHTRDRYLVSSLMEEAITSSQLEGAVTTRDVAKEMIRSQRQPRDLSEQMILNNYQTMRYIRTQKNTPLSPELIFTIHRMVTEKTLEDPTAAGRLRKEQENRVVGDDYGQVFHAPPSAKELAARMEAMCAFANGQTPNTFIHPVARAIILHFWLAYDHPFVDGNGRTARALFYWSMLKGGYWLFEFISISKILRKAQAKYNRSFLYTETDGNDLTYFLVAQIKVIRQAIDELHSYIQRKTAEVREMESRLSALDHFNHRQVALIRHALKHPGHHYTIHSHRESHNVVYQTARTDLLDLVQQRILDMRKKSKQMVFISPADLTHRLQRTSQQTTTSLNY
jgi:Fic family protein